MNVINVNDRSFSVSVSLVLQGLKKLGFDKAKQTYVTTSDVLGKEGISVEDIRSLVTTIVYEQRDNAGNVIREMGTVLRCAAIPKFGQTNEVGFELNYDLI